MRIFFFLILLLSSHLGYSQNGFFTIPDIDAKLLEVKDMVVDNDTIVIYGTVGDGSPIKWGQHFAKFDTLGNLLKTSFIIADTVWLIASVEGNLIMTEDGGYAICGTYRKFNQDSTHFVVNTYLMKVNHDLSLDFVKFYENPGYKVSLNQQLISFKKGYLLLAGEQKAGEHGSNWFVRYVDKFGEVIWKKSYFKANTYNSIYDVAVVDSNEIVIFGNSMDNLPIGAPSVDGFIYPTMMAIDTLGNAKWTWNWYGSKTGIRDNGKVFLPTRDGGYLLGGSRVLVTESDDIWFHPLLTKLDANLDVEWRRVIDTMNYGIIDQVRSIIETPDSNFVVSGGVTNFAHESIYHGKFGLDGSPKWERVDSTIVSEEYWYQGYVRRSALLSSGSIVSAGHTRNLDKNYVEWGFIMKLSPDGCMDTLACWPVATDDVLAQNLDYQLDVYPNPADDVVHFSLSQDVWRPRKAEIIISDVLGRKVGLVRYEGKETSLDVHDFPQGLYFYRLEVDGRMLDAGRFVVE